VDGGEVRKSPVEARTLKGFRDQMPAEVMAREDLAAKIRRVYAKFGFVPLDTPAIEPLEVLTGTGGEEINKSLFTLKTPEGESAALRFDLTVPFARLIAQYPDRFKLPFRRCAVGPVWRADKPDPGRWREFWQCDIDAAGSDSVSVDAEIVAALCAVMREAGLARGEYLVRINDRKVVDAFLSGCGITDSQVQKHVLRVVDKLPKAGLDNVKRELGPGRTDDSGDKIRGVGLDQAAVEKVVQFISVKAGNRKSVIEAVSGLVANSAGGEAAISELKALDSALESLGIGDNEAVFDPALARGLDYYTGPVFEVVLPGVPEFGSVGGGGRYDGLAGRFTGANIPATGASVGLDRFIAALRKMGKIKDPGSPTKVLVVTIPGTPGAELLRLAGELRGAGIATEVYFGQTGVKAGVKDQLALANTRGIPVAILMGEDELKAGTVSVKNMGAGSAERSDIKDPDAYRKAGKAGQVTVERAKLVETVRGIIGG